MVCYHSFTSKTVNQFEEAELVKRTEVFLCISSSNDMQPQCTEYVNVHSGG